MNDEQLWTSNIPCTIRTRTAEAKGLIAFHWDATDPSCIQIVIGEPAGGKIWDVARNTFIAAAQNWATGSWIGAGQFSVNMTHGRLTMFFRGPTGRALVGCDLQPVRDFLDHTMRLCQPGSLTEEQTNLEAIDRALEKILNAAQ